MVAGITTVNRLGKTGYILGIVTNQFPRYLQIAFTINMPATTVVMLSNPIYQRTLEL